MQIFAAIGLLIIIFNFYSLPNPNKIASSLNMTEKSFLAVGYQTKNKALPFDSSDLQRHVDGLGEVDQVTANILYVHAIRALENLGLIENVDILPDSNNKTSFKIKITPLGEKTFEAIKHSF